MVPHCSPEQLALAAVREPLPADDAAHLGSCDRCATEVAGLRRAVDAVAVPEFAAPGEPVVPPPAVWTAIAAATGVSGAPRPEAMATASTVASAPPLSSGADGPPASAGGQVLPFRARRRAPLTVAAAVLAGAVVGAGAVAVIGDREQLTAPGSDTLAVVALDPLADEEASGRAQVVVRPDGSRAVEVDLDAPALSESYYEIWLIDRDVVGMVPLGVLRPGTQTYELPDGLDLGQFPLVDVSVEPLDGDPAHSGVSVARGELQS
jgi:hypothetical protein